MVKVSLGAAVLQPASVKKWKVPPELEETVNASPPPPAVATLPPESRRATVMTWPAPPQTPAVNVRGAPVVKTSEAGAPATTVWVWPVGLERVPVLATEMTGEPVRLSR